MIRPLGRGGFIPPSIEIPLVSLAVVVLLGSDNAAAILGREQVFCDHIDGLLDNGFHHELLLHDPYISIEKQIVNPVPKNF